MSKTALITGISGQDGAYLSRFLRQKGYAVWGVMPRRGSDGMWRLRELGVQDDVRMVDGDLVDLASLFRAVELARPDEVYNLGAQSFVGTSWDQPLLTAQVNGMGVLNMLEAIRHSNPKIHFYQASTSEMFGLVRTE